MTHVARDQQTKAGLRWLPLNVVTALVLATVISLLIFMLSSSDGTVQPSASGNEAQVTAFADAVAEGPSSPVAEAVAPVTTTIAAAEVARDSALHDGGGGDDGFAASFPAVEEGGLAVTPVVVAMTSSESGSGPTEVALVTNFPALDYTWQQVELAGSSFFEMSWIGEIDGQLLAISAGWDESGDGPGVQTIVTWASGDGLDWARVGSVTMPERTWVVRIVGGEDRIYAVGENIAEDGSEASHLIMTSADGIAWSSGSLPVTPVDGQDWVYVQDAVVGPQGVAISLQYESSYPEGPQRLIFDDYEVELNHGAGDYTLIDAASGSVLFTGPMSDIYRYSEEDGQLIIDPVSGEELTVVPWDVWEQAYSSVYEDAYNGSPLPIPIAYGDSFQPPIVTIEHGGYVITIDEEFGTYVVANADGAVVAEGSLDILYQGPPPQLVDPATGDVVLSVTWDEWYRAEERAWETYEPEDPEFNPTNRTAILTSPDGETWSEQKLGEAVGGSSVFLTATNDGFVAVVTSYGDEYGERRTVWTMSDGIWTESATEQNQLWIYNVIHTGQGFVGIGDGPTGQAVWSSPDAISWASEFATAPQDGGAYVWLNQVASDGKGLVAVLASQESFVEYRPLVIEQDRYTAVFEDEEAVVQITENSSGVTVLLLTWEDFDSEDAANLITRDGDSTVFELDNGDAMIIADTEANSAIETRFADEAATSSSSIFLKSGNSWSEIVIDVDGGFGGASQMYLGDGRIFIAGTNWGAYTHESSIAPEVSAFMLIGTPAGS